MIDFASTVARLVRELRRRRVFRTSAIYVVGGWLVLQVADVILPGLGLPGTAVGALLWALVCGFPLAILFGWFFDIGAGGIRRTPPATAADGQTSLALTRTDYAILAAFAAVAIVLIFNAVEGVRRAPHDATAGTVAQPAVNDRPRLEHSVAVLPFANMSSDADNEFFCDGVSEEILHRLSTFRELNVIGRTSSFAFKGSDMDVARVSALLGVRFVLQGSVRKYGDQLRISAQLLDEQGVQIWSEQFDRELRNVFDIQSEIAAAVARSVASSVTPRNRDSHQPDVLAYEYFLRGRELLHKRDSANAAAWLERAVAADPEFAEAYAELAISMIIGTRPLPNYERGVRALERALELQPDLLRARAARGLALMQQEPPDTAGAETILRDVVAQDPNMSDALLWYANSLDTRSQLAERQAILERAIRLDPLHPAIATNLSDLLMQRGDVSEALAILERQTELPSAPRISFLNLRQQYRAAGRLVDVIATAKRESLLVDTSSYGALAASYALLGDTTAASAWVERSQRVFPGHRLNPFMQGILQIWQGNYVDAAVGFSAAGAAARQDDAFVINLYGSLLARSARYAESIAILATVVGTAPTGAWNSDTLDYDPLHALAWARLHSDDPAGAQRLLDAAERECLRLEAAGNLRRSNELFYCAENAQLRGDQALALARLADSVAAGWRDYYVRRNDPYWASLADHPRYRALMDDVKRDVDRQAAEVAQQDAADDFIARLDVVAAARRVAPPH